MDTEDSEYNAYLFYQLLEEQTSNAYTLVEDVKVTPQERAHDIEQRILNIRIPIIDQELALAVLYVCFRLLVVLVLVLLPFLNLPIPIGNIFILLIGIFTFF